MYAHPYKRIPNVELQMIIELIVYFSGRCVKAPHLMRLTLVISVIIHQLSMLKVGGEQLLRRVFSLLLQLQIGLMAILLGRYASTLLFKL
jgi:hypothetical protein